jgi:YidC/Oxa1 family membrane protein insertase
LDKRLPLALFLSFLILMAWTWLRPRPVHPPSPANGGPSQEAGEQAFRAPPDDTGAAQPGGAAPASAAPAPSAVLPQVGPVVAADEAQELELTFGTTADEGLYRARFTNRGAALVELRYGHAFDRAALDDAEKADPEHWVQLLAPVETAHGATRSMLLRADRSAEPLLRGVPLEEALWRMRVLGSSDAPGGPEGIEFTYSPGSGVSFTKRYTFDRERTRFVLGLEIANEAAPDAAGARQFVLTPAASMPANSGDRYWRGREPQAVAAGRTSPTEDARTDAITPRAKRGETAGALKVPGDLLFAGSETKYFALLVRGMQEADQETLAGAAWRKLRDEAWVRENPGQEKDAWRQIVTDVQLRLWVPEPGQSRAWSYAVYAGPKDPGRLEAANPDFVSLLKADLGMFQVVSRVLLVILRLFERLTGNWGVAIILLTILVRGALFPLNRRSQTAMSRYQAKMKRLQPRIDEIKERWKNDSQRQRQEQAKLMQEEGAFPPLGGCLPMFLQLPVFFGLYRALGLAYELRQSPFFGWINDLSLPDRLMRIDLNTHLPVLGTIEYLNVLPPLMVVMWVLQQRGMPKPADEQAARMQKMMAWMPVMMGVFLYNYASGLSLYVITQSTLGLFELKVIKKYWPVDDAEKPKKKKSGIMARLAEAQKQQMKRMQGMQRNDRRRRGPQGGGRSKPRKA